MIKLDLRKVALGYFMFLTAFLAYVLFWPKPLKAADPFAMAGGIGLGVFLALRIFIDSRSTEAFIFSRPVSRGRFFRQRWLLGLFLQVAALAFIALLLSIGARCWIHSGGPYHPMVKWYELNILWPIAISAPLVYSMTVFFMLRNRLLRKQTQNSARGKIVLLAPVGILAVCISFSLFVSHVPFVWIASGHAMLFYGILLVALTTWASRDCFTKMEVRS